MLLIVATLGAIGAALFRRQPRWLAHMLRGTPASTSSPANLKEAAQ